MKTFKVRQKLDWYDSTNFQLHGTNGYTTKENNVADRCRTRVLDIKYFGFQKHVSYKSLDLMN